MYHQIVADGYKNGDEQPQVIGWGPCAPCCAYVSAQCRMWTGRYVRVRWQWCRTDPRIGISSPRTPHVTNTDSTQHAARAADERCRDQTAHGTTTHRGSGGEVTHRPQPSRQRMSLRSDESALHDLRSRKRAVSLCLDSSRASRPPMAMQMLIRQPSGAARRCRALQGAAGRPDSVPGPHAASLSALRRGSQLHVTVPFTQPSTLPSSRNLRHSALHSTLLAENSWMSCRAVASSTFRLSLTLSASAAAASAPA